MIEKCPICSEAIPAFSHKALLYPGKEWDVHRCPQCEAFYFWPIPDHASIAQCYPHSYFRDFFKQYWKDYYKGRALASRLRRWRPKGTFLDVGCALGTLLAGVRDYSGWKVYGLDYTVAAAKAGASLHNIEIANGSLSAAPWVDGSLDYIHANNVLEHEADPLGAITAAARLLNRGGRIHLTLPNGPVDTLPNKIFYKQQGRVVRTRHSGHIFYYSSKSLHQLLKRAGLKLIQLKNFHFKTALKAHGWTPGAFKQLESTETPKMSDEQELSLDQYRALIPKQPSWPLYYARYQQRQLSRIPNLTCGYDFEVLAEK